MYGNALLEQGTVAKEKDVNEYLKKKASRLGPEGGGGGGVRKLMQVGHGEWSISM
jgi:hypothetical protein